MMFPGVFSGETRVHCWASSPTASPKFRCSIVLGFHHSLSLTSDEVEDDESSGSSSGPDGKPGPFVVPVMAMVVRMVVAMVVI